MLNASRNKNFIYSYSIAIRTKWPGPLLCQMIICHFCPWMLAISQQSYNQATEKTHLNCLVQLLQIKSAAPDFDIFHSGTLQGKPKLTFTHIKKL